MCVDMRLSKMEYFSVYSRTVKLWAILCIVLFLVENVVTQSAQNRGADFGLPLPLLKEGQTQGRSAVSFSSDSNFQSSNRPSLNPPFIVKFDDDSIVNPTNAVRVRSGGGIVGGRNHNIIINKVAGSLQHIPNPIQDIGVRSLLSHPSVLKKIQQETSSDAAIKVDSVITAHKQIVSGVITYLDVKVVKTRCAIGTRNVAGCEVDTSEDPYVCEVAVWERKWLNSTKVIDDKTRCAELESDNDFKNWNKGKSLLRNRNNKITLRALPHFLSEKQVALEAFDYIDRGSESKFKGHMVNYQIGAIQHDSYLNITTMDVMVEYGFTLCLKFPNRKVDSRVCPLDTQRENYVCSVTVMSDPKLTTNLKVLPEDDDDIECEKKQSVEEELVVPVQAVCMGCPQAASLNDPSVLSVAEFAVIEYDRRSDDKELHMMLRLNKASTQAVNGITYYLTLELVETDCEKPLSAFNMNRTLCNRDPTEEKEICEMVILEKPWEKSMEMLSSKCYSQDDYPSSHRDEFIVPVASSSQTVRSTTGFAANPALGPALIGSALPQDSLKFVLDEFNRREVDDNDDGFYKVINVIHSTSSMEPRGRVDHIVVELGETICTRRSTSTNCPLKIGEDVEVCNASVLRGVPNRLLSLSCDDRDDHYRLTSNPAISPYQPVNRPFFVAHPESSGASGNPIKHPVNSPLVKEMARFVVNQHNLQSDDDELYKLNRIIDAYSLNSANSIFTLELELLETECKKYQPVFDVSRCPVESTEEAEVCQAEVVVSGSSPGTKRLRRIFCDERKNFYVKKMGQTQHTIGSSPSNTWKTEAVTSTKMKRFGELIADEFDARSDEDNIFILIKVVQARSESTGLTHVLNVELGETVCPKYKQGINKTRCVRDIGEEIKICDAKISERPWKNDVEIKTLRCFERDDSKEEDESVEVYYPRVHPSAHARPMFPQSRFRVRQHSRESDESNEKYYRLTGHHHRQGRRFDSDEERAPHPAFRFDDDDEDSDHRYDNDSRSVEYYRPSRFRRLSPPQESVANPSIMAGGSSTVDVNDGKVLEIAKYALEKTDQLSADPSLRRVEKVLEASRKVVAGLSWTLKIRVIYTNCLKTDEVQSTASCEPDKTQPAHICTIIVWEKPWKKYRKVQEFECLPDTSINTS